MYTMISLCFHILSMEQDKSLTTLLGEQTRLYQHHLSIRNKSQKTLQYQNNIRIFKIIPKQFLPQKSLQLIPPTTSLTTCFRKSFEDLFFKHLDKVITSNTITLELAESQLRNITQQSMKLLADSTEPSFIIQEQHQKFIADNNITNPEPYSKTYHQDSLNPSATKPNEKANAKKGRNHPSGKAKDRYNHTTSPNSTNTIQNQKPGQTSSQQHFLDWGQATNFPT